MSYAFTTQAGDPVMLFNVKHEAFAAVGGSFACDSLPEKLKKEYEKGGQIVILFPITELSYRH